MNNIPAKKINLFKIIVYSEYLTLEQVEKAFFKWNCILNDKVGEESKIGEMTIKTNNSEGYLNRNIKSPVRGTIIYLANDYLDGTEASKIPKIIIQIRICLHTYNYDANSFNCQHCLQPPHKLSPNLETMFFLNPKPNNSNNCCTNANALSKITKKTTLKIIKMKGNINRIYTKGDEILTIEYCEEVHKIIAPISGLLTWTQPINSTFSLEDPIFLLNPCKHPEIFQELCTNCSEIIDIKDVCGDIRNHSNIFTKGITIVSEEEKMKYAALEKQSFISQRKLFLILDIDNTILHAMKVSGNKHHPEGEHQNDVYEWYINPNEKFVIKLRPYLQEFFEVTNCEYEVLLYTMGTRGYADFNRCLITAQKGAKIDGDKMIALEDNFLQAEKKIKRMLPYSHNMVLILDDNVKVWLAEDQPNLIWTKPFHYFIEDPNRDLSNEELEFKPYDSFLYFSSRILHKIYKIFFKLTDLGKKPDVREIYFFLRTNLFKGMKFAFTGIVGKEIPFLENRYVRLCQDHGAIVIENMEDDLKERPDILITNEFRKTHKLHIALKNKIPIIHYNWIDYCTMYCHRVLWETFQLLGVDSKINNPQTVEKMLVNENKAWIEENEENFIESAINFFK